MAAALSVGQERLAGHKARLIWQRLAIEVVRGNGIVKVFDPVKPR
jgi:hypothetical protein